LNINLEIKNRRHCTLEIGTVARGKHLWEHEFRRLRRGNMVDWLHTLIQNRTIKPPTIALSEAGRWLRERDGGGDLTNVQYKPIWNCHNESSHTMNIS
jgi:hypothetical protein